MSTECPLCERINTGEDRLDNELASAIADAFPVSQGHTLVVPRRHVTDLFAASAVEQAACWELVAAVVTGLQATGVDGINVGVNVGRAAGQTIEHAHIHVIPRFDGDVNDPRGGVRWVLPARAAYWSTDHASPPGG